MATGALSQNVGAEQRHVRRHRGGDQGARANLRGAGVSSPHSAVAPRWPLRMPRPAVRRELYCGLLHAVRRLMPLSQVRCDRVGAAHGGSAARRRAVPPMVRGAAECLQTYGMRQWQRALPKPIIPPCSWATVHQPACANEHEHLPVAHDLWDALAAAKVTEWAARCRAGATSTMTTTFSCVSTTKGTSCTGRTQGAARGGTCGRTPRAQYSCTDTVPRQCSPFPLQLRCGGSTGLSRDSRSWPR